ncbi:MAG: NUDIX hydrolase [Patescibacteria group bacterium]
MKTKLKKWKKISSRLLFRNKYFELHKDVIRFSDGRLYDYFVNNPHGRAVHVLAIDQRGHLLVTKEYRHPVRQVISGAIGGSVERGETPRRAAEREMREETGYRAKRWQLLGQYYANPARSGTVFYVYTARGLKSGTPRPESTEIIEYEFLSLKRLDSMIMKGQIKDAYFLASYLLFRINK